MGCQYTVIIYNYAARDLIRKDPDPENFANQWFKNAGSLSRLPNHVIFKFTLFTQGLFDRTR